MEWDLGFGIWDWDGNGIWDWDGIWDWGGIMTNGMGWDGMEWDGMGWDLIWVASICVLGEELDCRHGHHGLMAF